MLRDVPVSSLSLVFTLQQGKATQTISVKMDQVLTSELAARTFGQVATSQLEDVCGAAAAAEPVATAYARHFRVTGRTCSLLMLESEQDYARFNIKPEEDSFVVKDRPADAIVAKAVAETTAAMGDPKANFLAWYRRVRESSRGPFRSAGLAGCRPGGPAGRDVRGDRCRRCNASCGSARNCRKTCGSRGRRACRTTKRWPPRPSGD